MFWSSIFIIGMGISFGMSWGMFDKFYSSKLLTSIESTHEPLNRFEFPAVTVCSQNHFSKSKLKQVYTQNRQLQALTEAEFLFVMKIMIKPDFGFKRGNELKAIHDILAARGIGIEHLVNFTRQVGLIVVVIWFW